MDKSKDQEHFCPAKHVWIPAYQGLLNELILNLLLLRYLLFVTFNMCPTTDGYLALSQHLWKMNCWNAHWWRDLLILCTSCLRAFVWPLFMEHESINFRLSGHIFGELELAGSPLIFSLFQGNAISDTGTGFCRLYVIPVTQSTVPSVFPSAFSNVVKIKPRSHGSVPTKGALL